MLYREAVSQRIYELCNIHNYTLNKLAEMSCVPPSTLQDLVNKKVVNPSSYVIYKICKTLNIEMKDFFDSNLFQYSNIDD